MKKMPTRPVEIPIRVFNQQAVILIILFFTCLVGLLLYTYNLKATTIFSSDFARDTLRTLEIWQNREITFIGSPLSLQSNPEDKIYFTSLSLYLGIPGLVLSGFKPIGPTMTQTFLYLFSIPFVYLTLRLLELSAKFSMIGTILYAISPVTVYFARIFWTPSNLIPFSVFFWFFALNPRINYNFLAGLIAGVMFNIHYISLFPIVIFIVFLFLEGNREKAVSITKGCLLGLVPFLVFELRNEFFLSKSFFERLTMGTLYTGGIEEINPLFKLTIFFSALVGLRSADITYNTFLQNPLLLEFGSLIILILLVSLFSRTSRSFPSVFPSIKIFLSAVILWAVVTKTTLHTRYLFSTYPIFIYFLVRLLTIGRRSFLLWIFLPFMLGTTFMHLGRTQRLTNYTIPLELLERISETIISSTPGGRYNITENVTGDATGTAIRFFLLRDARVKPQAPTDYSNLDMLYVVTPNLRKTYSENRWEFRATENLELVESRKVSPLFVYKFYPNRK